MNPLNFFAELKRRNVYKVAVAYAVVGWVVIQVSATVLPTFHAPEWVVQTLVVLVALGFPIALVIAWAFELTAEGLKRTEDANPFDSRSGQALPEQAQRKSHAWIYVVIVGAAFSIGLFFIGRYTARDSASAVRTEAATGLSIPQKSIAVLPFENLSAEKENAYFVEGIQDEILTRLAKISALKVISRTSTMRYASRPDNLREIAQELGVAHILEGSVQRAAGSVRVNVQLIEAQKDSHLWAESYDRELKNIFSVESEVAQSVADALRAKLLTEETARVASVPTNNPEAHDLFLKAEYFANQITTANVKNPVETVQRAADLYGRAVAADPGFALAYARLSYLRSRAWWYNFDPSPEALEVAESAARRALTLQPELGEAHLAMGLVHYWGHRDYGPALAEFDLAQKSLPNSATVQAAISFVLRRQSRMDEALHGLEKATALNPRDNQLPREIASTLLYTRRYTEAVPAFDRALAIVPDDYESQIDQVTALLMKGDLASAGKKLAAMPPEGDVEGSASLVRWQLALALRQPDQALAVLEHAPAWLLDIFPSSRQPVSLLRAQALVQKGEPGPARALFLEAKKELEGLLGNPRVEADTRGYLALVYAGLGDKAAALDAGRRATTLLPISRDVLIGGSYLTLLALTETLVGEKDSAINHLEQLLAAPVGHALSVESLRLDPRWDPIRDDPRFKTLLAKYGVDDKGAAQ